jgi:hypothetical protein
MCELECFPPSLISVVMGGKAVGSFSAGMASADFAGATEFNLEELWHYWKGLQR